jgi:hypothetical protein
VGISRWTFCAVHRKKSAGIHERLITSTWGARYAPIVHASTARMCAQKAHNEHERCSLCACRAQRSAHRQERRHERGLYGNEVVVAAAGTHKSQRHMHDNHEMSTRCAYFVVVAHRGAQAGESAQEGPLYDNEAAAMSICENQRHMHDNHKMSTRGAHFVVVVHNGACAGGREGAGGVQVHMRDRRHMETVETAGVVD